ncbi:hypothetical protein [Fructobacillus tropaeoli]|uniref:hypothetical protein n=1 Tax=Fructobacillus tropaeoli TaxID=709323 RepID=UPI0019403A78|nr:hypothetical protein [Fructobacillus tropaeoli]GIC69591.1 hypothetical protein FT12353_02280 [Fructobacillus tropaeoli]
MTDYIYLTREQKLITEQAVSLDDLHIKLFRLGHNPEIEPELFNRLTKAYKNQELIRVKLQEGEY